MRYHLQPSVMSELQGSSEKVLDKIFQTCI
jgi:hypothetical protein